MKALEEMPGNTRLPTAQTAGERRLLALMAILLLHALIFLAGAVAAGIDHANPGLLPIPHRSTLRLLMASFLMAQCSLAAIALGKAPISGHWKAVLTTLWYLAIWGLLQLVLESRTFGNSTAASWLAALATQGYLVAWGSFALQVCYERARIAGTRRYTILLLLIWTTIVATLLGAMRWLAQLFSWELNVLAWDFFGPLQVSSVCCAALALSLHLVVSRRVTWTSVAAQCMLATLATTTLVVAMTRGFSDPGLPKLELCWLMGSQSLFLLAVLIPLHAALAPVLAQTSMATLPGTISLQTPPPPGSGR